MTRLCEMGYSKHTCDRDIPRAGGTARDELRDDARPALTCRVHGVEHRRLFDQAVLDETLWQAAEAGTT